MQQPLVASIALSIGLLTGCAQVPINADCEWPSEEPLALDLSSPAAVRHLIADAQLADDLAIRFADTEHGRRTGYGGHGGLLENGRVINECRAGLFGAIASAHHLPIEQVLAVRTARPRLFDVVVFLSFAVLYGLVVWNVVPVVLRRFAPDGRWVTLAALLLVSLGAGATGLQLGELWATAIEMVRLGDDHLGQRGLRIPWGQHRATILGAGIGLFWAIAAMRFWIGSRRDDRIAVASAV